MVFARNAQKFIRSTGLPLEERYMGFASYCRTHELAALLPGTDSAKALETHPRLLAATRGAEPLHRLRYLDLKTFLASDLLIRGRRQKYVLKRTAGRYLPAEVVDRPKTGTWALLTFEMWAETFLDADGLEAAA
jgi:hypothetical protein